MGSNINGWINQKEHGWLNTSFRRPWCSIIFNFLSHWDGKLPRIHKYIWQMCKTQVQGPSLGTGVFHSLGCTGGFRLSCMTHQQQFMGHDTGDILFVMTDERHFDWHDTQEAFKLSLHFSYLQVGVNEIPINPRQGSGEGQLQIHSYRKTVDSLRSNLIRIQTLLSC